MKTKEFGCKLPRAKLRFDRSVVHMVYVVKTERSVCYYPRILTFPVKTHSPYNPYTFMSHALNGERIPVPIRLL